VDGGAPRRYLDGPATVTIGAGDAHREATTDGVFRLELDLPAGPPREVVLRSDRDFDPDAVQRNGDRRRLALKVFRFGISAR
jgi:hypothetical protein